MEIKRAGAQPSGAGPDEHFTGTVRIDPLFDRMDPARSSGAGVTFEPRARTAWHTQHWHGAAPATAMTHIAIAEKLDGKNVDGAPHVVEAVGNQESLDLAVNVARPGGTVSFVGVPHNVKDVPISTIFYQHLSLRGGPAPVRAYLPQLIESLEAGRIDPSPVFDRTLPLSEVAEGYAAMDERRALKVLLTVS